MQNKPGRKSGQQSRPNQAKRYTTKTSTGNTNHGSTLSDKERGRLERRSDDGQLNGLGFGQRTERPRAGRSSGSPRRGGGGMGNPNDFPVSDSHRTTSNGGSSLCPLYDPLNAGPREPWCPSEGSYIPSSLPVDYEDGWFDLDQMPVMEPGLAEPENCPVDYSWQFEYAIRHARALPNAGTREDAYCKEATRRRNAERQRAQEAIGALKSDAARQRLQFYDGANDDDHDVPTGHVENSSSGIRCSEQHKESVAQATPDEHSGNESARVGGNDAAAAVPETRESSRQGVLPGFVRQTQLSPTEDKDGQVQAQQLATGASPKPVFHFGSFDATETVSTKGLDDLFGGSSGPVRDEPVRKASKAATERQRAPKAGKFRPRSPLSAIPSSTSGVPRQPHQAAVNAPVHVDVVVPHKLNNDQSRVVETLVPEVVCKFTGNRTHSHPIAHTTRTAKLFEILRNLSAKGMKSIYLVGVKPSHVHTEFGLRLHFNFAPRADGDVVRYKGWSSRCSSCTCKAIHKCTHATPDLILIWDRIYFFTPVDLALMLMKFTVRSNRMDGKNQRKGPNFTGCELMSWHQTYEQPRGGFYVANEAPPEFRYRRTGDGVIVSETNGRFNDYRHSAADWLREGGFQLTSKTEHGRTKIHHKDLMSLRDTNVFLPQKLKLSWGSLYHRCGLELLEFNISKAIHQVAPQRSDPWSDNSYFGNVDFGFTALRPNGAEVQKIDGAYSIGDTMIIGKNDSIVHKDLILSVSIWAQGKTYDDKLVEAAFNHARNISRGYARPIEDTASTLADAVYLGLAHAIHQTTKVKPGLRLLDDHIRRTEQPLLPPIWKKFQKGGWPRRVCKRLVKALCKLERGTRDGRNSIIGLLAPVFKFIFGKGLRSTVLAWFSIRLFAKAAGFGAAFGLDWVSIINAICHAFGYVDDLKGAAFEKLKSFPAMAKWCWEHCKAYYQHFIDLVREFFAKKTNTTTPGADSVDKDLEEAVSSYLSEHDTADLNSSSPSRKGKEKSEPKKRDERDKEPEAKGGSNTAGLAACGMGKVVHKGTLVGSTYCAGWNAPVPLLRNDAKLRLPDELPDPHDSTPLYNPVISIGGIMMSQDQFCVHNEIVGLKGRVLQKVPKPSPGYWDNATTDYVKLFDVTGEVASFETWASRFPTRKEARLHLGRDNHSVQPDWRKAAKTLAHVKTEIGYNITPDGEHKHHHPRIIQASSAEESVEIGPAVWSKSKAMLRYDMYGSPALFDRVFYCPGKRAEELDAMLAFIESQVTGELVYITMDGRRFDCHIHHTTYGPYLESMRQTGFTDEFSDHQLKCSATINGRTKHGVKYATKSGQRSGQNTTSHKNSEIEMFVLNRALQGTGAYAADCSDDAFVVCSAAEAPSLINKLIAEHAQAGIEIEVNCSRHRTDMEFCSGRFWPADNEFGFAYGPKFGKLLPKLFTMRAPELLGKLAPHVRGVCRGLRKSVAHVPIAHEYIEHCLHLAEKSTMRKHSAKTQQLLERMDFRVTRDTAVQRSDLIYEEYQRIYGLTRSDIDDIVAQIRAIKKVPATISHYLFQQCVEIDIEGAPTPDRDPVMMKRCGLATIDAPMSFASTFMSNMKSWSLSSLALMGVSLMNQYTAKALGWNMTAVLVAPVLEETARYATGPYFTLQIIISEFLCSYNETGRLYCSIPAACMHVFNTFLHRFGPIGWAASVVIHTIFNALMGHFAPFGTVNRPATLGWESKNTPQVSTMNRSSRKVTLQTLVDNKVLTDSGKNWLTEALDPFHDSVVPPTGYPDLASGRSVIQTIRATKDISRGTLSSSANWDANIVMWPFASMGNNMAEFTPIAPARSGALVNGGTSIHKNPLGSLTCVRVPSGNTYNRPIAESAPDNVTVDLPSEFVEGTCRVVAMGFEVVNTTAALNRQGSVAVYQQPVPAPNEASTHTTLFNPAGTIVGTIDFCCIASPPANLQEAVLLAGTQIWKAEDGVYIPSTQSTIQNPPAQAEPRVIAYKIGESGPNTAFTTAIGVDAPTVTVGSASRFNPRNQLMAPFNLTGAYFTGLSPETTLTVTAVWYIERFPVTSDRDLVVLARPCASYDPMAFQLYLEALNQMPIGCKQGENPLGEWFRGVVNKIAGAAAPALKMASIVHPGFGIAGSLADGVRRMTDKGVSNEHRMQIAKTKKAKVQRKLGHKSKDPRNLGPGALDSYDNYKRLRDEIDAGPGGSDRR